VDAQPLTRRNLLAAAGAAAVGAALPGPLRALSARADGINLPALSLGGLQPELVSVTGTSASFWWVTKTPADTTIRIATDGGARRDVTVERGQVIHAATIEGLQPGRHYRYELFSDGVKRQTSISNPGHFDTLVPPKGPLLARIAVVNDIHTGEGCSGTIQTVGGTSVPPCFHLPNYAIRMTGAAVRAIRKAKVDLLIANGDLSDRGRPDEIRSALAVLRRARVPLVLTRGNHDRLFDGCTDDRDCLKAAAFGGMPKGRHALTTTRDVGEGLTVIGLDSTDPESGRGDLLHNEQMDFLRTELARAASRGRRVVLCFHHPVTPGAIATALPPISFGVEPQDGGNALAEVMKGQDHVVLVLHGHTHRNYVSYMSGVAAPFLECGALKEYGGAWTLLEVHTDGVMRTSHRLDEPFCREWVRTSAQEYEGIYPSYTRGPLNARAFVHHYDAGQDVPPTLVGFLGGPSLLG
jgi:3',5'-cyclic AMP phosphodiesterase CpdA